MVDMHFGGQMAFLGGRNFTSPMVELARWPWWPGAPTEIANILQKVCFIQSGRRAKMGGLKSMVSLSGLEKVASFSP